MTKITEKQLIEQIKTLKEIKPRKEWAVLLKSQILAEKPSFAKASEGQARFANFGQVLSFMFSQKKLAYSFAVVLFFIVGVFGFATYTMPGDLLFPAKKIAEQSQASLTGQTQLKQNVTILSNRVNDLTQLAKEGKKSNMPSAISEVNTKASELAKSLKSNIVTDQATIKEIANSLKTLASVPGADLTATPELKSLNDALAPYVENEIKDLKVAILTDEQKMALQEVENLYNQGKYNEAMIEIYTKLQPTTDSQPKANSDSETSSQPATDSKSITK